MKDFEIHMDKFFLKSIYLNNIISGGIVAPQIRTLQTKKYFSICIKIASIDSSNYAVNLSNQYLYVDVKSDWLFDNSWGISLYSFIFYIPKEMLIGEVKAIFHKKELIIKIIKGDYPMKFNIQIPIVKEE